MYLKLWTISNSCTKKNTFKLTVVSFSFKNFTNQKIPNENLVDLEKLKGDKFEELNRNKNPNIIASYKSFLEKLDFKAKFCLLSQLEQSMVIAEAVNYLKKLAKKV